MKNIGEMIKMAQEMQTKIQDLNNELSALEVTGESGGGMVTVLLNGNFEARKVEIEPALFEDSSREFVQDLIAAAINDASHRMERMREEKREELMRSMGVPAGFKLPF